MDEEKKNIPMPVMKKKKKASTWKMVTVVLVILLAASILTSGFRFSGVTGGAITGASISKTDAGKAADGYINSIPGVSATLEGTEQEGNFYIVTFLMSGRPVNVYVTLDGGLMFPAEPINLKETATFADETEAPEPQEMPKTEIPKVQLFVMSQCPFGTIAETAMKPVAELFGQKIDLNVEFIATETGEGIFNSLHGQPEVDGDIRQLCVIEHAPDKFWNYIECVNENYQNLDGNWERCASENSIDVATIQTCFDGQEGADLLSASAVVSNENQVSGSPTLIINGVKYQGGRTAEAYKQAICSAFSEAPAECDDVLSSEGAQASGSC